MELWIEGTPEQVIEVANAGFASAIATNPSIMERWTSDGKTMQYYIRHVCSQVSVPVYVQLRGPGVDEYLREMDALRQISDRIHPKLVASYAGIEATRRIAETGLKPLVTTIATLNQAYLSANANAAYIAPYVGRLLDGNVDAYQLIADISAVYQQNQVKTQIAAASIRSPQEVEKVLLAGAPILVMQHAVFSQLLESELGQGWIDRFDDNWTRIPLD